MRRTRPTGTFEEAKLHFSGHRNFYAFAHLAVLTAAGPPYFLYFSDAFPGSMHDTAVFNASRAQLQAALNHMPAASVIIGDAAYAGLAPLNNHPVVAVRPYAATDAALRTARRRIEMAFGGLKEKYGFMMRLVNEAEPKYNRDVAIAVMLWNEAQRAGDVAELTQSHIDLELGTQVGPREEIDERRKKRAASQHDRRERLKREF
jgi:integrase